MAQCTVCGNKAGAFKEVCQSCDEKLQAQERAAQDKAILEERARAQAKSNAWQESFVNSISDGAVAFAYKAVYLPIDSVLNNETLGDFNIAALQQLGLWGWRVVGVMPRTIGIGLTNVSYGSSSGETWGAGIGGNVAGVYVLLAREVLADDETSVQEAVKIGRELIDEGLKL